MQVEGSGLCCLKTAPVNLCQESSQEWPLSGGHYQEGHKGVIWMLIPRLCSLSGNSKDMVFQVCSRPFERICTIGTQ